MKLKLLIRLSTAVLSVLVVASELGGHAATSMSVAARVSSAAETTRDCSYAPTQQGYLQVAANGQVFSFGNVAPAGTLMTSHLNKPIVSSAANADGRGEWLVGSDGGVFTVGDAGFYGSTGGINLVQPIVGMAATPDGGGYWLVASDGGVFAFGDAHFYGSTGGLNLTAPIIGLAPVPDGSGYWLSGADGGIFNYGTASFQGSTASGWLPTPIVSVTAPTRLGPPQSVPVTNPGTGPTVLQGLDYYYAGAQEYSFAGIAGASIQMCAAPQPGAISGEHSLTELAVYETADSAANFIEVGIDEEPNVYQSTGPHLFVSRWTNGTFYRCADPMHPSQALQECSFTPTVNTQGANSAIPQGVILSYSVDQQDNNWNVYVDGELIGYFPDSLWNGSFIRIQQLKVYGEVAVPPGTPSLAMGNGLSGTLAAADHTTGLELLGGRNLAAQFQYPFESQADEYAVAATTTNLAYGGPDTEP